MVPAGDAALLAKALGDALARDWDPEKMRASVESLSWNDVGDTYHRLLKEVIACHRPGRKG
jgi:hypothetical protein